MSISINTQTDSEEIQNNLTSFLEGKDYGEMKVHVNVEENETQIKINAALEDDEVVTQLSSDISDFLVEK
jgi:hypothetical protein